MWNFSSGHERDGGYSYGDELALTNWQEVPFRNFPMGWLETSYDFSQDFGYGHSEAVKLLSELFEPRSARLRQRVAREVSKGSWIVGNEKGFAAYYALLMGELDKKVFFYPENAPNYFVQTVDAALEQKPQNERLVAWSEPGLPLIPDGRKLIYAARHPLYRNMGEELWAKDLRMSTMDYTYEVVATTEDLDYQWRIGSWKEGLRFVEMRNRLSEDPETFSWFFNTDGASFVVQDINGRIVGEGDYRFQEGDWNTGGQISPDVLERLDENYFPDLEGLFLLLNELFYPGLYNHS